MADSKPNLDRHGCREEPRVNPFSNFGKVVHGAEFIGRQYELERINQRLIQPRRGGSIAIIGEPRIGKSSLAYTALIDRRDDLVARRKVPFRVNLSTYHEANEFFLDLVMKCQHEIDEAGLSVRGSAEKAAVCQERHGRSWNDFKRAVEAYFAKLNRENLDVACFIDEFDDARRLFRSSIAEFQELRDLASEADYSLALLITSRRTIEEIEKQCNNMSTLAGIVHEIPLSVFDSAAVSTYYERLAGLGIVLRTEEQERLRNVTGHHPFFLARIGFELVDQAIGGRPIDLEIAINRANPDIHKTYRRTLDILKEEGMYLKLLQILYGPVYDATPSDVAWFKQYGIIVDHDGDFVANSPNFESFLRQESFDVDVWPLWCQTVRALREMIHPVLERLYTIDWCQALADARPKLREALQEAERRRNGDFRQLQSRASTNLLVYIDDKYLFEIVKSHWSEFEPTLRGDRKVWEQDFELLKRIRNWKAHVYPDEAILAERVKATGVCKLILERLDQHTP